jgi:hypothetical protein
VDERYAIVNWTTRKTQGPYRSFEEAREALDDVVAPGEEYTIWCIPAKVGAGQVVEERRRPN